jgi:hypothetical protein
MKCLPALLLLAASFSFAQSEPQSPPSPKITYVRCGSLYDGRSDSARKNITLRIVGDKIDQIGETVQPDKNATVIDLSHEVCLPD